VPTLPDNQFERYLKQFRPLAPEQLQLEEHSATKSRTRALAAWGSVAAAVIIAFLIVYPRLRRLTERGVQPGSVAQITVPQMKVPQPLTIRSADALLADAPSFKAAVDTLALPSHATSFGVKQSALEVLGKDSEL